MERTRGNGKSVITRSLQGGDVKPRHADRTQGAWINYQFKLCGVTQEHVATMSGVTRQMVQRVSYGVSTSAHVQRMIALAIGYKSWMDLVAARQGVAA